MDEPVPRILADLQALAGDPTVESGARWKLAEPGRPHGSTRNLTAGADGMSYLTVHRRRPGLQIKSAESK